MVNSGKRKYTKKKVMRGGAISFSFIPFSPNGKENSNKQYTNQGTKKLIFIDGTKDTFFNTYIRVKILKTCSKVYFYLTDDGNRIEHAMSFQLIYHQTDNKVYQYNTTDIKRLRLVKQQSQMSVNDVEKLLNVTPEMLNPEIYKNVNSNPAYKEWESKLYSAILTGQISIDQIFNYLYTDGDNHKDFKAGKYVSSFWTKFKTNHIDMFLD